MPVFLDVELRGAQRAAAAAAKEITSVFEGVGRGISRNLGGALSEGLASFSTARPREQIDLLKGKLTDAAQAQDLLAQRAESASLRSTAAWRSAEDAVDKYGAASVKAMRATAAATDATAAATYAASRHAKSVDDTRAAHDNLTTAVAGSAGALGRFNTATTVATTAIVGGFAAGAIDATKAAGDFQVQLTRLSTVGGELPKNMKAVHDGLMSLASATGWSPTELATGMLKVEQAGYRGADALTVMKAAAQGAAEEGIGLDEAANAVTTTLHDYHLNADQAANVTSKMIEAVRLGKTTFADFTGALHNVEPTASAVGESLQDLLATLSMMTQSGMHADQASDNLNHALSSLGTIQPKQREMLAALGLDPRQIPNDVRTKGYIGTAQEIRTAVDRRLGPDGNVVLDAWENNPASQALEKEQYGRLSPTERAVADRITSGQLSQKDFRKSRGGLGVTESKIVDAWLQTHERNQGFNRVLTGLNTDQLGQLQALQTAVGGQDNARTLLQVTDQNNAEALQHRQEIANAQADPSGNVMEFQRSQQNFNAQWKDLKASLDALKIEFGEDFLPTATKWVQSLETGVHWMQQHRQLVKELIEDATVLSGIFLAMKLSTALVNSVKGFREAFGLTKTAVDQTNTSMRETGPAAQAATSGVNAAASEEVAAQQRVKNAVYQANQELRDSGSAAQAGAAGVEGGASEEVTAENRVRTAAMEANAQMRGAGAAAEAGAAGVVAAANTEIGAMNRVMGAAGRARGALAAVGGAAALAGGAVQASTAPGSTPNKIAGVATDAGTFGLAGSAIGSLFPGPGTLIGGAIGVIGGAAYGVYDQFFNSDNDQSAAPSTPDNGPVPVVPTPDTSQPTPDVTPPVPEASQPETPDTPYSGGGGDEGGKKKKDDDPLDEDLKRLGRLETESREIQARLAEDRASNDPARRGEIPWLQKKLDGINKELAGIRGNGKGRESGEPWMPVKLDDNWLQGGLPGLVRNTVGYLEDLVLGPMEVAAFHGIPDFDSAYGKGGSHTRRGRRSREEGIGPGEEGLPELPGGAPGIGGAGQGVVPVFVTNWGSGGPSGSGAGGGLGSGVGGFGGESSGAPGGGGSGGSVAVGSSAGSDSGRGSASSGPGQVDLNGPLTPDQIRSLSTDQQRQLLLNAFHPGASASGAGTAAPTGDWGLPGGGTDSEKWLLSHLAAAGFSASEIRGILAMNRVESGGSDMGMLGLTQGQAPSRDDKLSTFLRQWRNPAGSGYHGAPGVNGQPPGVDANGNVVDSNRFLDWLSGAVEGQDALQSDWQGNAQPADYRQRVRDQYSQIRPPSASTPPAAGTSGGKQSEPPAAHNFYKDWYPAKPRTDADILPPEALKDARDNGMLDANGNLIPGKVPMLPPTPGSLNNPKSVAPTVQMQPDPSRLLNHNGPPPKAPEPSQPWVNPRANQPWYVPDDPNWPQGGSHFNFPKLGDTIRSWFSTGGLVRYFADGGPSGTDTIPAWLSPGEFVVNADATKQYLPFLQHMNSGVGYYAPGTDQPLQPGPPQPAAPNNKPSPQNPQKAQIPGQPSLKAATPQPGQKGVQDGPPPPADGSATAPQPFGSTDPNSSVHNLPGLATPGADSQQPGQGLPASPGIGFNGGVIGSAEGAASAGADMFAPGSGAAAQLAFQEINRAAAFGAQAAGIGVEGILEALIPSSGAAGGDWGKTIPGRILMGVTGVRPQGQNTAGNTQQAAQSSEGGSGGNVGVQVQGDMHVHANDVHDWQNQMNRESQMASGTYTPSGGR